MYPGAGTQYVVICHGYCSQFHACWHGSDEAEAMRKADEMDQEHEHNHLVWRVQGLERPGKMPQAHRIPK